MLNDTMFRILVLIGCLAVFAHARRRYNRELAIDETEVVIKELFNSSPDCKATFGDDSADFTFRGCNSEFLTCSRQVRDALKSCVTNEVKHFMTLPRAKVCEESHHGLFADWFKAICKTKMDLKRCMDGEEAPAHETGEEHMYDHDHLAKHMKKFKHACWTDLKDKYMDCKSTYVLGCNHKFKTCTGEAHAEQDALEAWYWVAKHNKHHIAHKLKHAQHHFKKCLAGDEDHEAHDHGDSGESHEC